MAYWANLMGITTGYIGIGLGGSAIQLESLNALCIYPFSNIGLPTLGIVDQTTGAYTNLRASDPVYDNDLVTLSFLEQKVKTVISKTLGQFKLQSLNNQPLSYSDSFYFGDLENSDFETCENSNSSGPITSFDCMKETSWP